MKNRFWKRLLFSVFIPAVFLSACVSLKGDIFHHGHRDQAEANLTKVEEAVVPLEAAGGIEARRRQSEVVAARQIITELERETSAVAAAAADAEYRGKLLAWSGRLAILEGRFSEAQRLHRQSISASPGNIPSLILGIRLEGDPSKRLDIIERELTFSRQHSVSITPGVGELNIERGRSLMELNRFTEAAGAFDIAFSSGLNPVYLESYGPERARAWELRNTSGVGSQTLNLLGRETISWNDCITLIKNETQLFRFLTGGRDIPNAELFSRLLERGFIPFSQDITLSEWPLARPAATETVTRAGAAWLAWHLHDEIRADRTLLTRYSARFATGANPRSPIADIPPLSPFFDSILGCVETELMSLPDGRNFRPTLPIRGTELLAIIRRIDN
jgi:tetratricopeptide (TPR) repeat protein